MLISFHLQDQSTDFQYNNSPDATTKKFLVDRKEKFCATKKILVEVKEKIIDKKI